MSEKQERKGLRERLEQLREGMRVQAHWAEGRSLAMGEAADAIDITVKICRGITLPPIEEEVARRILVAKRTLAKTLAAAAAPDREIIAFIDEELAKLVEVERVE